VKNWHHKWIKRTFARGAEILQIRLSVPTKGKSEHGVEQQYGRDFTK